LFAPLLTAAANPIINSCFSIGIDIVVVVVVVDDSFNLGLMLLVVGDGLLARVAHVMATAIAAELPVRAVNLVLACWYVRLRDLGTL